MQRESIFQYSFLRTVDPAYLAYARIRLRISGSTYVYKLAVATARYDRFQISALLLKAYKSKSIFPLLRCLPGIILITVVYENPFPHTAVHNVFNNDSIRYLIQILTTWIIKTRGVSTLSWFYIFFLDLNIFWALVSTTFPYPVKDNYIRAGGLAERHSLPLIQLAQPTLNTG